MVNIADGIPKNTPILAAITDTGYDLPAGPNIQFADFNPDLSMVVDVPVVDVPKGNGKKRGFVSVCLDRALALFHILFKNGNKPPTLRSKIAAPKPILPEYLPYAAIIEILQPTRSNLNSALERFQVRMSREPEKQIAIESNLATFRHLISKFTNFFIVLPTELIEIYSFMGWASQFNELCAKFIDHVKKVLSAEKVVDEKLKEKWLMAIDDAASLFHDVNNILFSIANRLDCSRYVPLEKWRVGKGISHTSSVIAFIRMLNTVRLGAKGVLFNNHFMPDVFIPEAMQCDFLRVMNEIILNAIRFADLQNTRRFWEMAIDDERDVRFIDVAGTMKGQALEIIVSDNGLGMADVEAAIQARISDKGRKGGLAIARDVCRKNKWGMDIHSEKGVGTQVTLQIDTSRWKIDDTDVIDDLAAVNEPFVVSDIGQIGFADPIVVSSNSFLTYSVIAQCCSRPFYL